MSTLTSKDLNIERSSTRLFAPPGGKTSISFGYDEPEPAQPRSTAAKAQPVSENITAQAHNAYVPPARGQGGKSSIAFGDDNMPAHHKYVAPARGQGGKSSISFGDDSAPMKTTATAPVVAPLGNITNALQGSNEEAPVTARRGRQPPGGASTIFFG